MNRKEYINNLKFYLQDLPENEIEDIIYDYKEHFRVGISRGKTEEEISEELGDPRNIAKMFKNSLKSNQNEKDSPPKNLLKIIIMSIALGFFNLIIVLGPFIGIIGLLIGLYGMSIGFTAGGIGLIFSTIGLNLDSYFLIDFGASSITSIAFGIGLTSLGLLALIGSIYATKFIYKLIIKYIRWNIDIITK
ncbi:MAG: DUF1700 domain-containing protein [Clostridiaceae bacterium]|nr:DUF1700 domain-containing protein [Clostridiaceae bacterium]MBW4859000.1 DUF1700 domain-containing protein [Clostridiaceae bacterium]MBW4869575.1 DUF1700 domain-containing protein [Clostridiaceae bacterium]